MGVCTSISSSSPGGLVEPVRRGESPEVDKVDMPDKAEKLDRADVPDFAESSDMRGVGLPLVLLRKGRPSASVPGIGGGGTTNNCDSRPVSVVFPFEVADVRSCVGGRIFTMLPPPDLDLSRDGTGIVLETSNACPGEET